MKLFNFEFMQDYAEGLFGKAWAFINGYVVVEVLGVQVSAKLWMLAAAAAAFMFWSSLIGLFGALVG